jgi:hypothetical protein
LYIHTDGEHKHKHEQRATRNTQEPVMQELVYRSPCDDSEIRLCNLFLFGQHPNLIVPFVFTKLSPCIGHVSIVSFNNTSTVTEAIFQKLSSRKKSQTNSFRSIGKSTYFVAYTLGYAPSSIMYLIVEECCCLSSSNTPVSKHSRWNLWATSMFVNDLKRRLSIDGGTRFIAPFSPKWSILG